MSDEDSGGLTASKLLKAGIQNRSYTGTKKLRVSDQRWDEWLHPRGKDGQFIEHTGTSVTVYADPKAQIRDPKAKRCRATIRSFSPNGARVVYTNNQGKRIPPDPDAGFPEVIPGEDFSQKVMLAPKPIARINPDLADEQKDGDNED